MTDYLNIKLDEEKIKSISNLGLAHIGDCVYELLVRTYLCSKGHEKSSELHKLTIKMVSATAQANAMKKMLPILSEEETDIYKRGRNTHVNSVPHGASVMDYHSATGLETLFGLLYLQGNHERINELFRSVIEEDE